MHFARFARALIAASVIGALGIPAAHAGPLALIANFNDPGPLATPPFPPGTVTVIDTATDKPVGAPLTVGVNPEAIAITPDGTTAIVACAQSSDLWWIDLTANPPALAGK